MPALERGSERGFGWSGSAARGRRVDAQRDAGREELRRRGGDAMRWLERGGGREERWEYGEARRGGAGATVGRGPAITPLGRAPISAVVPGRPWGPWAVTPPRPPPRGVRDYLH